MSRELISNIHGISGAVVFIIGLLQLILKKGGKRHQVLGNIYLYIWLVLLITGGYIGSQLVTIIGIFGFYFTLTGSRIGQLKNKPFTLFDKTILVLGGITTLYMLYSAVILFINNKTSFAIIFTVFGFLFGLTTRKDILKYIYKKEFKSDLGKMDWYFEHFNRMAISFIAAVTAFASIQNIFNNNTLNFLAPTAIGIILIAWAKSFYKKKFNIK